MERRTVVLGMAGLILPAYPAIAERAKMAPEFDLASIDGSRLTLEALRGRIVIADFWATWCGPCRIQIPVLNAFAKDNPDIAVLGISVDSNGPEVVPGFIQRVPIHYPVLYGSENLARRYGIPGFPSLAVITADGQLARVHVGLVSKLESLTRIVTESSG